MLGTFTSQLRLESMDGQRRLELEALVDTGAMYTLVPAGMLEELGVARTGKIRVQLADGRIVPYDIGEARASANGATAATVVIFGDEGARILLGAYTLQGLRLAPDPSSEKLVPAPIYPQ